MTKRPSPFEPNICRQSKIHFSNLENDEMAQKEVEKRTLQKLVDGSKKLNSSVSDRGNHFQNEVNQTNAINLKSSNFMQMSVANYFRINGDKINERDRVMITSFEAPSRCFFCETKTNSVYQCGRCLEVYCSGCSFVNYESPDDKRICMSCS